MKIARISMMAALMLGLCLLSSVVLAEEKAKAITWQEAMNKVGDYVTVEAKVVHVHTRDRGPDMLNFDKNWRDSLSVAVFNKEKFGNLKEKYLDKKIKVTGKVSEYRNAKQIKVYDPSKIEVVE